MCYQFFLEIAILDTITESSAESFRFRKVLKKRSEWEKNRQKGKKIATQSLISYFLKLVGLVEKHCVAKAKILPTCLLSLPMNGGKAAGLKQCDTLAKKTNSLSCFRSREKKKLNNVK